MSTYLTSLVYRHLSWSPDEANLLVVVSGILLLCSFGALLLTRDLYPGSGHLSLTLASN